MHRLGQCGAAIVAVELAVVVVTCSARALLQDPTTDDTQRSAGEAPAQNEPVPEDQPAEPVPVRPAAFILAVCWLRSRGGVDAC